MSKTLEDSVEDPVETTDSSTTPEGEAEGAEELPADVEVLKQRLKDTQKAFHTTRAELSKTKSELDKLSGKVEVLTQREPTEQETKDWLDSEFADEEIQANPAKSKEIIKRLRGEVGGVLKARDEWILGHVKQLIEKAKSSSPELDEAIQKLREDSDYEGFSDEQLSVIARKTVKPSAARLPPSIGGRRNASVAEDSDITKHPLYKKIYGDE